jgi:hypothetical protein
MKAEGSKVGSRPTQSSIVAVKAGAGVPGERRVLVQQKAVRREYRFEFHRTVDVLAHFGQQAHPGHGERLVVFRRVAGPVRERADCVTHPIACFFGRGGFLQESPGDAEVLAMVKILVADIPALESAREFAIGDALRGRWPLH